LPVSQGLETFIGHSLPEFMPSGTRYASIHFAYLVDLVIEDKIGSRRVSPSGETD